MDVIVIGGGIVGVSVALSLAEAGDGVEVTVLEQGSVAGAASGLNAGLIGGGGWGQRPDIETTLKMGSRDRIVELAHDRGRDIGLDLAGTLILLRTEEEWAWAEALVAGERAAGRHLELVPADDLATLEPAAAPGLQGAVFDPRGARAEPVATTRAVAAEATAAGAVIETGWAVAGLRPLGGGGWEVSAADGTVASADAVVIAAGPWCAEVGNLIGLDVPIVAVRGQMWASVPRPPLLRHGIAAAESALAWTAEHEDPDGGQAPPDLTHRDGRRLTRHLYGRQRPNGEIVFGGDRVLSADPTVDGEGITTNHEHVAQLLTPVRTLPPARVWAGLMPFSLDGRPLLGPVAGRDGLFLAGGLASSGFGRGPMAGQLVADLVLGRDPGCDLAAVLPGERVGDRG